jgi:hypothetical protein
MLFNSWQFVALVFITAVLYFLPAMHRAQRLILLIASMIFMAHTIRSCFCCWPDQSAQMRSLLDF